MSILFFVLNMLSLDADLKSTKSSAGAKSETMQALVEEEDSQFSKSDKSNKKEKFGPFFESEPYSDLRFPNKLRLATPSLSNPLFSWRDGFFCWVEDAKCSIAVLFDADIGAGINLVRFERGYEVPHSQWRVRAGLTMHPSHLASHHRQRDWHPWSIGLVSSWSIGSPALVVGRSEVDNVLDGENTGGEPLELSPIQSWRLGIVNQLWLHHRNFSPHLDLTVGAVNSSILDYKGRYWGSHVELACAWGGWGGFFVSADFLDRDTRILAGFRAHGFAALPITALVVLGLAASGGIR